MLQADMKTIDEKLEKAMCENSSRGTGSIGIPKCYDGKQEHEVKVVYHKNPFNKEGETSNTLNLCTDCMKRVKSDAEGHGYNVRVKPIKEHKQSWTRRRLGHMEVVHRKSLEIDDPFEKARSHKYIRRTGAPKQYHYIYQEPKKPGWYDEKTKKLQDWAIRNAKLLQEGKTMKMEGAKVEHYALKTATGKHIRTATKVTFPDGQVIRFTEKMGRQEAIRQATGMRQKEELRTERPYAVGEGKTMKMERPFGLHEPTEGELEHENHRINTMSQRALEARMHKITDPQKMYSFAVALEQQGMHGMAQDVQHELSRLGYHPPIIPKAHVSMPAKPKPQHPLAVKPVEMPLVKPKGKATAGRIMNHLNNMIERNYTLKGWNNIELEERHKLELDWMTKKFDFSKMSKKEIDKIKLKLEDENWHGPASYLYKLSAELDKPKAVLPAKGEKIKGKYPLPHTLPDLPHTTAKIERAPRHIVLSDPEASDWEWPGHDAYREALLAKEKKEGGVKKDKAGNIVKDPGKRKAKDPWANMPGYGRTYSKALQLEAPFKKSRR